MGCCVATNQGQKKRDDIRIVGPRKHGGAADSQGEAVPGGGSGEADGEMGDEVGEE